MTDEIQLISDLHIEFTANYQWLVENPIKPIAPILIIAGDTAAGSLQSRSVGDFLRYCSTHWEHVVVLLGNHEFYRSADPLDTIFPSYEYKLLDNVTVVNNRTLILNDIPIICSTLWTRIHPQNELACYRTITDFRLIEGHRGRRFTTFQANEFHTICMRFLEIEVNKYDRCVVATHHAPSTQCNSPKYYGQPTNDSFVNNLDRYIDAHPQIRVWVYGHTHHNRDFYVGGTRVVCNSLGYVMKNEHHDFQLDLSIKVMNDDA